EPSPDLPGEHRAGEDAGGEEREQEPDLPAGKAVAARRDDDDEEQRRNREVADGVEDRGGTEERLREEEPEPLRQVGAQPERRSGTRFLERRAHGGDRCKRERVRHGVHGERERRPERKERAAR